MKRQGLVDSVNKLERNLEAEIKRRMEADKSLQNAMEAELSSMHEKHSMQMREMQMSLTASIDALSRTFADLHNTLREEKEQRRVDIEHVLSTLLHKVDETQAGLDDERVARLEREAQSLKRVGEDIFRLQEKLDLERVTREQTLGMVQADLREVVGHRAVNDDKFQAVVLGEIAHIKNAMQLERDERIAEDEQIVHAINDYTQAMQDGLRLAIRQ